MKTNPGLLLAFLVLRLGSVWSFDPFSAGPFQTEHKTYYPLLNTDLHHLVDVFVPVSTEPLNTPILYMVGGWGGLLPGAAYASILNRVASFGFTVVQPWMLGNNPISNYEGLWLDDVMYWVENHLKDKLDSEGVSSGLELDHRTIFLFSHSAGGHVAVEYLKHHCGDVKGQILFSPVDGFDPYGLVDLYAITPGEYLNYEIPTLVMMCGLDSVKGIDGLGDLITPCAPEDLSNMRFFNAMPGETWLINATDYGHGDALEPAFSDTIQATHACCPAPKEISRPEYRRFVGGEVVTFMSYVLGRESCDIVQYMQDPALMPINTVVKYKESVVSDTSACSQGHCDWQKDPFPQS